MSEGYLLGLTRRLQMAVGFGRMTAPVRDDGPVQRVQVRFSPEEVRDDLSLVQHYGLASVPPVGSDVVAVFLNGDRSNGVGVAHNLQDGRVRGQKAKETSLYNGHGMRLYLAETGPVLECGGKPCTVRGATAVTVVASEKVVLDAPLVEATGDLHVKGEITAKSGAFVASAHRHLASGGTGTGGPPSL